MRLLVVGAGYTGKRVARLASTEGWTVLATTTTPGKEPEIRALGAEVVVWNGTEPLTAALGTMGYVPDAIVWSVPPSAKPDEAEVCRAFPKARFVYISSTSVYGVADGSIVDEDTPCDPMAHTGEARVRVEEALRESGEDVVVVRPVGIYGPGRTLVDYIRKGRYRLVDGGVKVTNRIHVDDLARIVWKAATVPSPADTYVASDGTPVAVVDLVDWLVENVGVERPEEVSIEQYERERGAGAAARWRGDYRASNRRVVEGLGVELQYPTVFDGYRAIFGV